MAWKGKLNVFSDVLFHFSSVAPHSAGLRSFLSLHLADVKTLNPNLKTRVFGWDEVSNATLRVTYDWGLQVDAKLDFKDEQQIISKIAELVEVGERLPRAARGRENIAGVNYSSKPVQAEDLLNAFWKAQDEGHYDVDDQPDAGVFAEDDKWTKIFVDYYKEKESNPNVDKEKYRKLVTDLLQNTN